MMKGLNLKIEYHLVKEVIRNKLGPQVEDPEFRKELENDLPLASMLL